MSDSLLPTSPETPNALANAEVPKAYPWIRAIIIDTGITVGLAWAAFRGYASWDALGCWLAAAVMSQAKPNGSTVETAVKAIGSAFARRGK